MTNGKGRSNEEAQIRALIEERTEALRAKAAARVVSHGAPDLVRFSLAPPLISTEGDAKGLEAWFATWQGPIGYEIRDLAITAGEDVAFCHSLARMRGTRTNGDKTDLWFRQTLCLRKISGAWKVVHEHASVPFYMDGSFRAAVDLQP